MPPKDDQGPKDKVHIKPSAPTVMQKASAAFETGKFEQAAQLFWEVLKEVQHTSPEQTVECLQGLGDSFYAQKKYFESRAIYMEQLDALEQNGAKFSPEYIRAALRLADCCARTNESEDALQWFARSRKIAETLLGPGDLLLQEVLEEYVKLLRQTGKDPKLLKELEARTRGSARPQKGPDEPEKQARTDAKEAQSAPREDSASQANWLEQDIVYERPALQRVVILAPFVILIALLTITYLLAMPELNGEIVAPAGSVVTPGTSFSSLDKLEQVTFQPHGKAQVKAGSTEKEIRFTYPHRGWSEFLAVFMPGPAQSWLVMDGTSLTNGVSKLYTMDDDVIVLPRMIDDTGSAIAAYTKRKHTLPTEAQLIKANPELAYKTAGGVDHTPQIVRIDQLVPGKESSSPAGNNTAGGGANKSTSSSSGTGKDQSSSTEKASPSASAPGAKAKPSASGAKPKPSASGAKPKPSASGAKAKPSASGAKAKPSASGAKSKSGTDQGEETDKSGGSGNDDSASSAEDQAAIKAAKAATKAEADAFAAVKIHPETLIQKVPQELIKPGAVICVFLPKRNYGVVFGVDSKGHVFTSQDKTAICVIDRDSSNHFDFPITINPVFYHFPGQIVVSAKPLAAVRTVYSNVIGVLLLAAIMAFAVDVLLSFPLPGRDELTISFNEQEPFFWKAWFAGIALWVVYALYTCFLWITM